MQNANAFSDRMGRPDIGWQAAFVQRSLVGFGKPVRMRAEAPAGRKRKSLKFANGVAVKTSEMTLAGVGGRRLSNWAGVATGTLALGILLGTASGQVPRYQSPIEAPQPQLSMPAAPPASIPNGKVVEYPVARVNDQIISNSDYERTQKQILQEEQQANASPAEIEDKQKNLLRDMIDQQLLLSRGKELDVQAESETIRRLDEIRKQNHLDSMEALEKAVREQGISYEDWRAGIKNSVITQQVIRDEVGRNIRITPRDEQAFYEAHKQEFVSPEHIRLSEILIPTPDDATDAQVQQAKAKADEVAAKLKDGGDFTALAKQYSGGPNADSGGDLGEFKRGDLGKVLEDQTFPLKQGEWTAPIRTRQGYVILKVVAHSPEGVQPLSAVEDQVQQAMYEQAIQPALRTYLTKLRENAFVDVAPGFVDTGASPKQTKPVFQGASPLPLKKKQREKARMEQQRAAAAAAAAKPGDATSSGTASKPTTATNTLLANGKKKKIRREKIRFGQPPRDTLPDAAGEVLPPGADQGAGAASASQPASGTAMAGTESAKDEAATAESPAAPVASPRKTRYTEREPMVEKEKAAKKVKHTKEKAAAVAPTATTEESLNEKAQAAPLGLNGDTATKKKKKRAKGEEKERLQKKAPEPPAPTPDATPIPPRSVRDNGEPAVTPAPALPPTNTAPAGAADTTPAPPAAPQNSTPTPPQQ